MLTAISDSLRPCLKTMWSRLIFVVICISHYAAVDPDPPIVAFSMGQSGHVHLTQGEVVTYNKDFLRIGTSIENGQFIVKTPGLYAFHFFSLTRSGKSLWLELTLNDNLIASTYGHTVNSYADAGNSVILSLDQGDVVAVKAHGDFDNSLYGVNGEVYTTFTGVLLDSGSYENALLNRDVPVGFAVTLSQNVTLQSGQVVPFDTPITYRNTSSFSFHMDSNAFVAPNDGLYIFHVYGLASGNQEVYLELYHNDQYVESIYGWTSQDRADAGNTAILHLMKGDQVTVRAAQNAVGLYGSAAEKYTTFSGALLALTHPVGGDQSGFNEVAFSVGLDATLNLTDSQRVKFNRQFTNMGRAFDMSSGTFTAPVDGFYAFHFHGLSESGEEAWLELFHNYQYVDSLYAYDPSSYASGSNAAVLRLNAGDEVYVKSHGNSVLYGASDEVYCTFSGYLIAPVLAEHTAVVGR